MGMVARRRSDGLATQPGGSPLPSPPPSTSRARPSARTCSRCTLQQSCEKRPEPGASRQVAGRPGREHSPFCADALPVPAVTFRPRAGLRRTSPGRPRSDGGPSRGPSARLVGEGAGAPPGLDAGYGGPRCQRVGRRRSATTPPRRAWAAAARTWCATAARPVLNTLPPPAYFPAAPATGAKATSGNLQAPPSLARGPPCLSTTASARLADTGMGGHGGRGSPHVRRAGDAKY